MINIISATKFSETEFWEKSALGLSLARLRFDVRIKPCITYENKLGLPWIYNAQIIAADTNDVLVFVHDDVWLDDCFIADHILDGLMHFDVIGIAGNIRRIPHQPAWMFSRLNPRMIDETTTLWEFEVDEKKNLSGSVCIGAAPSGPVEFFGQSKRSCELLDGVFLATARDTLIKKSVYFDSRFDFHFYDLDFCRTARSAALKLGTWPISMTHQSEGQFGTESWSVMHHRYLDKWKD